MSKCNSESEFDTEYQEHIICPHCGTRQKDVFEFQEENDYCCGECEKKFFLRIHRDIHYTTQKV